MTVAVWLRPPLVPVIVTVYEPVGPEQERVDVPPIATEVGDSAQLRPPVGATAAVRATVLLNPSRPVAVIVEPPVAPARVATVVGLAATKKS